MALFASFIRPTAVTGAFDHWRVSTAFGAPLASGRCSGVVQLTVDAALEAALFAPFAGKLTTDQPTGYLRPRRDGAPAVAELATLTLYLEPTDVKFESEWKSVCAAIADRVTGADDADA